MLTEEALLLLVTIVASGFLVLGVLELLWPARSRHSTWPPVRPSVTPVTLTRRLEAARAVATATADERASRITYQPIDVVAQPNTIGPSYPDEPGLASATVVAEPPASDVVASSEPPGETVALEASWDPAVPLPVRSAAPRSRVLPVDTCRAMYDDGRFTDVVSLGSAALEVHAGLAAVSHRPDEAAALLDLVGLAKERLGDRAGACVAFREALRNAGSADRASYARHLVEAVRVVAESPAEGSDDERARLRELRECLAAVDEKQSEAPDEVAAVRPTVREAIARACERLAASVGASAADAEARDLVLDTLADPEMPAAWRERLCDQVSAGTSAEIGQLTAQAIRLVQAGREGEALQALERAQRLSEALPSTAVSDERREEFERRLWWGYNKIGLRRIDTRAFDAALEPLFRALRFAEGDADRATETLGAVVRALEGVVDEAAPAILRLVAADAGAARAEAEKLYEVLRASGDRGVKTDELEDLLATVTRLEEQVALETR